VKADDSDDRPVFNDADIVAAQRLIAAQCAPQVSGLMEPGVVLCARRDRPADRVRSLIETDAGDTAVSLQIVRVNGNHWLTVSCVAGDVTVSAPHITCYRYTVALLKLPMCLRSSNKLLACHITRVNRATRHKTCKYVIQILT